MHEEEVRLATHYRQFQTDHEYISDSNRSDLGKYSLKYVQVHKMSSMALKDIPYNNFFTYSIYFIKLHGLQVFL